MTDADIKDIKHKSVKGMVALTARTFTLQIVGFVAMFLLTLLLTPSIFGVYYVVSAVIAFLGYFSDIGLAAALVQKKDDLSKEDIQTTFTIQQLLVGTAVLVALFFSYKIGDFYKLDASGVWLFRALVVSFFLSSLKTIPSILMERALAFERLVIPTIVETLGFYVVAVFLAWKGFGVASFSWAVLCRGILGVMTAYIVWPWMPSFGISKSVARRLLKFGIPFQMNSFLAVVKDDLLIVFLGKALPFSEVGYLGWAKKWAEVPLRLIMDSVIRVTFPAFSRIQHDKILLGKALEKTMYGLSLTIFPISIVLLFFVRPLVYLIPKYTKWEPALLSFYFFVGAAAIAGLTTPLTNALNAIGKIKTTLLLMVMWTTLTWVVTVIFIHFFGFQGVAFSIFLITFTIGIVVKEMQKIVPFSFVRNVSSAIVASVIQALWYATMLNIVASTYTALFSVGLSGVILYMGCIYLIDRNRVVGFIKSLRS